MMNRQAVAVRAPELPVPSTKLSLTFSLFTSFVHSMPDIVLRSVSSTTRHSYFGHVIDSARSLRSL